MKGKIIAISNNKGGVGKTTTTVNLAAGLANRGKKVLLIDFDPQANLTYCFGISKFQTSIYKIIKDKKEKQAFAINNNIHIVPTRSDLANFLLDTQNTTNNQYLLKTFLNKVRNNYDYTLIDCPPSLGILTINAFIAADEILIPLQAHYLAVKGLTRIISVVNKIKRKANKKLTVEGVVLTFFDTRVSSHQEIKNTVAVFFKEKLYFSKIRQNIHLAESSKDGVDIFQYKPNSNGANDYNKFCDEFVIRHSNIK